MSDLKHWDYVDSFRVNEIASLILGIEPEAVPSSMNRAFAQIQLKICNAFFRPLMEYRKQLMDIDVKTALLTFNDSDLKSNRVQELIDSTKLHSSDELLNYVWQLDYENCSLEVFNRVEISRWLVEVNLKTCYVFMPDLVQEIDPIHIDPEDRPEELDLASIAWHAVRKGYGDQTKNFKKRLYDYLDKTRPDLSKEARERIAIVANEDKKPGPKPVRNENWPT